jgi:copper resistance protein C
MMSRSLAARLLLTLMAASALLASAAGPASAHNTLLSSTPSDGETVPRMPEAVVLVFDDSAIAMGAQVVVTGPSGPVQTGSPTVVDNSAQQPLAAGAPAGNYTVAWRVTSADGHPITGTFQFTARAAGGGQAPQEANPPQETNPAGGALARGGPIVVAALVLAAGTGVFLLRKRRRTLRELAP